MDSKYKINIDDIYNMIINADDTDLKLAIDIVEFNKSDFADDDLRNLKYILEIMNEIEYGYNIIGSTSKRVEGFSPKIEELRNQFRKNYWNKKLYKSFITASIHI